VRSPKPSLVQHDSPYHGVVLLGSEKYNLSDISGAAAPAHYLEKTRSLTGGHMPFAQGANAKGLYFNPDSPTGPSGAMLDLPKAVKGGPATAVTYGGLVVDSGMNGPYP